MNRFYPNISDWKEIKRLFGLVLNKKPGTKVVNEKLVCGLNRETARFFQAGPCQLLNRCTKISKNNSKLHGKDYSSLRTNPIGWSALVALSSAQTQRNPSYQPLISSSDSKCNENTYSRMVSFHRDLFYWRVD